MAGGFTLNPLEATKQLWNDYTGVTANEMNSAQAQRQMDFQERMSNSAYQRGTADMKAAGLNPMLAYSQGGASTPQGSSATMQKASSAEAVMGIISKFTDVFKTQADTASVLANKDKTIAETPGAGAVSGQEEIKLRAAKMDIEKLEAAFEQYFDHPEDKGKNVIRARAWEEIQYKQLRAQFEQAKAASSLADLDAKIRAIEERVKRLGIPQAELDAIIARAKRDVVQKADTVGRSMLNSAGTAAETGGKSLLESGKRLWNRSGYGMFHQFKE